MACTAPLIINLSIRLRCMVMFEPQQFSLQERVPQTQKRGECMSPRAGTDMLDY